MSFGTRAPPTTTTTTPTTTTHPSCSICAYCSTPLGRRQSHRAARGPCCCPCLIAALGVLAVLLSFVVAVWRAAVQGLL